LDPHIYLVQFGWNDHQVMITAWDIRTQKVSEKWLVKTTWKHITRRPSYEMVICSRILHICKYKKAAKIVSFKLF
jgi:hypothetical protein